MKNEFTYDNDNAVSINYLGFQADKIIKLLSKSNYKQKYGVVFDLYNRIKYNLGAIAILGNKDWTMTPSNIIYRSIIADLMVVMYHLLASDEDSAYCIELDNYKHAKSFYEFLKSHCKLAIDYFCHTGNPINHTEQELVNRYEKYFSDYIRVNNGKWEFIKPAKYIHSSYNGTIQSVANFLEEKKDNIDFILYLNMCYKELSQTEHYSVKGRLFAFNTSENFYKFHKVILHGVICSTNQYVITTLLNNVS